MPADTGVGWTTQLTYNTVTFNSSSDIKVKEEPIWDDAHRAVLYQQITINVRTVISAPDSSTLSNTLQIMRTLLNEPGRPLTFKNAGFGDALYVNWTDGSGVRDLKFGPKPEVKMWEQIGSSRAVEVEWSVTVCVPTCNASGSLRSSGLMALNYGVSTQIDHGWTTRTISGYLEVAMTRMPGTKRIADTADNYRNMVSPVAPLGFDRNWTWDLSPDKSRAEFSVTDTEIRSDQAYPSGITNCQGEHFTRWMRDGNAMVLYNGINMRLETTQDNAQSYGWNIFYTIVKNRLSALAENGARVLLLRSLDIREDIWGKSSDFSLTYTFLTTIVADFVKDMLNNSGIWKPIGTDWTRWRTSMANVFDPYGQAELVTRPENDVIVDLCSTDAVQWGGEREQIIASKDFQYPTFKNKKPDPKQSYIKYKNYVVPKSKTPVQRQRVLQKPEYSIGNGDMNQAGTGYESGAQQGTKDILQSSGLPSHDISLVGYATRAGYPVPRPTLAQAGNEQPVETYFIMPQAIVGDWFGVPIYEASWRIDYALAGAPGKYPVQPNPREDLDGDGK